MSFQNIPPELRALPQWVAAGENKQPIDPNTGDAASVTDPATWGTFEQATAAGLRHVGFVLSKSDPFCVVDLDDPSTVKVDGVTMPNPDASVVATIGERHARILAAFDTYAEISQSGLGVHIVCRGEVPHGVRRDKVEVYSDSRYMIFTGNVIKAARVTDQQALVSALFAEIEKGALQTVELDESVKSHFSDDELYSMASTAANAEKFLRLWRGEWQGVAEWPSQSEADFALLAMLGFYSPDNEQVRRVFRFSALGQREKATKNNRYLNYALSKIRAKTPPPCDLSALISRGSALVPEFKEVQKNEVTNQTQAPASEVRTAPEPHLPGVSLPPGLVGDLAAYIYSSAIRPVPEIALAAAIALTAGIAGRAFNISGSGLNHYIILLAKTGSGKEGAATGIDALIQAVRPTVPMIDEFIGPSAFASGQALVRVLDQHPCFVSILGEFGLTLQQLCSPNANAAQVMLKKVLLDIYAKSGHSKTLRSSVYSDSDKNTKAIQAPNVTILGESTPETFYSGLDASSIAEGLIPRFSIFEYEGPRPDTNPNAFAPPPESLARAVAGLAAVAMAAQQNRAVVEVKRDADTVAILRAFDRHATDQINSNNNDVTCQLWNRAHLKALKMAALIAVGVNPHNPVITKPVAEWAIDLVNRDIERLLAKFESGEVGTGDVRLELDVRRAVAAYLKMKPRERIQQGSPEKMATLPLVPFQFLRRRLRLLVNFKNDRRGANNALAQTLAALVEGEVLLRISPIQARDTCGTNSPVFGIGPAW